jgi:hypothetical protein
MIKLLLLKLIKRKVKKAMFKKLIERSGITALIVGAISAASGVDIAPDQVDVLVSAGAIIATVGPAIFAGIKNRFFAPKE